MENKSTVNKWLITAAVIMGIIIVAMATCIIAVLCIKIVTLMFR